MMPDLPFLAYIIGINFFINIAIGRQLMVINSFIDSSLRSNSALSYDTPTLFINNPISKFCIWSTISSKNFGLE